MTDSNDNGANNKISTVKPFDMFNPSPPEEEKKIPQSSYKEINWDDFEQPVLLRQSPVLSRAIIWGLITVTTLVVGWAFVARIDEAVSAQGKLEPTEAVKEIQSPVSGVVKEVHVKEGDEVQAGDLLITFDQDAPEADLGSLQAIRTSLSQENEYYLTQIQSGNIVSPPTEAMLKLSPELLTLTKNRASLISENQLYRSILAGNTQNPNLTIEQQERMRASLADYNSRVAERRLEVEQLNQQLAQVKLQLVNARDIYNVNRRILGDIEPLLREGGIARVQVLRQEQEMNTAQTNVNRFVEEEKRLELAIAQARQQVENTMASSRQDLLARIENNEQRIAEIDSQVSRLIRQNEQRIQEIDGQLSRTQINLDYQVLRAPVSGKVFDLKATGAGFVANSSESVLKIVPADGLVARIYITNRDIGFVEAGMPVDVRIDSFPYSEFGDVKGELIRIGSDALPPDQIHPYYRFPAEIALEQQALNIRGKEVALQSGMSISANIKVSDRRVIDIFTNLFKKKVDSLENVR